MVNAEGVPVVPTQLAQAIKNWPLPQNEQEVRSFLVLASDVSCQTSSELLRH
jgi:hypothetical protein